MELRRRSSGTAKAGLATGIVGSSLGLLNSMGLIGGGINAAARNLDDCNNGNGCGNGCGWWPGFGWNGWNGYGAFPFGGTPQTVVVNANDDLNRSGRSGYYGNGDGSCSEDHFVNRYELGLQQQIAEKDSQIALRDANTYNDQKMLEMYKYIDGQLKDVRSELGRQAVINQQNVDSFAMAEKDLQCTYDRLSSQIDRERDERKCNDNIIVTYANATFYPKSVADVTVGTTTTQQDTYNPLPCSNNCNCGNR